MNGPDKLVVKGLGALDGEYEFDIVAMLGIGNPDTLTNREGHRIKAMTGLRVGDLEDALAGGDSDVIIALAAVILTRKGKRFDEDVLWDAPIGSGVMLNIGEREPDLEDEALPPPLELPETHPIEQLSPNGGSSGESTSDSNPENDPSRTGLQLLETPTEAPGSDPETLAI